MTAPAILQTYPADSDTGIPIGIQLAIVFDKGIDLSVASKHVVLYGDDFDQTSGPHQALWIDPDTGNNPYFLRSPGFKGVVELDAELVYVDLSTGPTYTEVNPGTITSEADEAAYGASGVGHKLILTPRESLAPDVDYTWHILGDPDGEDTGITARTVFDVEPDVGNTSTTGDIAVYGGYDGANGADTVIVEITTGGDIGDTKYKWYFSSLGVGSAVTGRVSSRRYRVLDNGLQIRFTGSGFVTGDIYRFNVEPPERLATTSVVTFATNDGTYTAAPDSPSTPATSSPPASVLPPAPGSATTDSQLEVVSMNPANGSYYNSKNTRTITVQFSDTLDPATITDDTVTIYKYPVSGLYNGQPDVVELEKILTVSGDTLTIDI